MVKRNRITKWLFITLIAANPISNAIAQGKFSISACIGSVQVAGNQKDAYGLNTTWPVANTGNNINTSSTSSTTFYEMGTGISKNFLLSYDITRHLGLSLAYQSVDFTASQSHRSGTSNSLGVNIRINFRSSTKKVIPFFAGGYFISNSSDLHQEKATSTVITTQTQPAYYVQGTTNLGFSDDLGLEFKLTSNIGLVAQFGFHGLQLPKNSNSNIAIVAYPAAYSSPTNVDGVFYFMGSVGIRVYLGSGKKRDF